MLANEMPFVNDEAIIGKRNNIGWIDDLSFDSIENLNPPSGDFNDLYFLPNGEPYWIFEGWTKGYLLIHYGGNEPILTYKYETQTISQNVYLYEIRSIKGIDYLFLEWKM